MRNLIAGLMAGAALTLGGVWLAMPNCPTEDSCRGDYVRSWYGGHWTGKEQTP